MADPECKTNLRAQRSFAQVSQLGSWQPLRQLPATCGGTGTPARKRRDRCRWLGTRSSGRKYGLAEPPRARPRPLQRELQALTAGPLPPAVLGGERERSDSFCTILVRASLAGSRCADGAGRLEYPHRLDQRACHGRAEREANALSWQNSVSLSLSLSYCLPLYLCVFTTCTAQRH